MAEDPRDLRKKFIEEYFGKMSSMLTKNDDTSTGTTDDKEPDKPSQKKCHDLMMDDARKLANCVFSKVTPQVIAEVIATGMAYDTSQACTRVSKLYNVGREEFYKIATRDTNTRKARAQNKALTILDVIEAAARIEKAAKELEGLK